MSLLIGTTLERIKLHLDENCHSDLKSSICEVIETSETGKARVVCTVREGDTAIQWHIGHKKTFAALASRRSADGTILVTHSNGTVTAHIIECTATVGMSELQDKLKPQFLGSLVRLISLCAIADLRLDDVVFYAAFRKSRFLEDPVMTRLPITDTPAAPSKELILKLEWLGRRPLYIPGVETTRVEFRQIRLADDEAGSGAVTLDPRISAVSHP